MIDYLSIEIPIESIEFFIHNPIFNFQSLVNLDSGEILTKNDVLRRNTIFKGFKLSIATDKKTNKSILTIKGSIHKYHENGYNYTDFGFNAFKVAINSLFDELGLEIKDAKVKNIEFGVNIQVPNNCKTIIDNLVSYDGEMPTHKKYDNNGIMCEFRKSQYLIKIYDKGAQISKIAPTDFYLLRYEIRTIKMGYLRNKGINIIYLSDLLELENWDKLRALLVKSLKGIVYFDTLLNTDDDSFLLEASNPRFWQRIKKEKKDKKYRRTLEKYNRIVETKLNGGTKKTLQLAIESKLNELIKDVRIFPI